MKHQKPIIILLSAIIILVGLTEKAFAKLYPEKKYQYTWCQARGGQMEVVLNDNTRVDCLLQNYAIEFDFAQKWCEAIGQSLYYSYMTNKKAGIVLIMENPEKDRKYLERLCKIAPIHGITVWVMTAEDIN